MPDPASVELRPVVAPHGLRSPTHGEYASRSKRILPACISRQSPLLRTEFVAERA
jgi:hypothetical protein